jgi:hypothetical protein
VLYYDCYWMPAICANYQRWLTTPQPGTQVILSQQRSMATKGGTGPAGLYSTVFGMDVSSSKTTPFSDNRGLHQRPGSWSTTHTCLEQDANRNNIQPAIMPDFWSTTDREVEDPLNLNEIRAEYFPDPNDPTGQRQILSRQSGRYYTCEEWPPRRLVELCFFVPAPRQKNDTKQYAYLRSRQPASQLTPALYFPRFIR